MNRTGSQKKRPKKRILYIDDDLDILEVMEKMISYLGYDVSITSIGYEAIELIRSEPARFDLVITDYNMPDINGLELSEKILNINPKIPIILGTGSIKLNEEKVREAGINAFLQKPFSMEELMKTIQGVLDNASI